MSAFLTDLVFRDTPGHLFALAQDLRYSSDLLQTTIVVPAEFPTDLASIPWLVQCILPKIGRWDRAAVVHDFLYSIRTYDRGMADSVLNEAMAVDRVGDARRRSIYAGVRLGGWNAWRKHKTEKS